jgi:hypothetical protein
VENPHRLDSLADDGVKGELVSVNRQPVATLTVVDDEGELTITGPI